MPTTSDLAVLAVSGLSFMTQAPVGSYYLRVKGTNTCGPGPASATQLLTVGCTPPGPPGTPVTAVSGSSVTLTWTAVAAATQYQVEIGTAAGASNVTTRTVTGSSTQVTGLPAGTYFTRIRSVNACGPGATSGEASFVIPFIRRIGG